MTLLFGNIKAVCCYKCDIIAKKNKNFNTNLIHKLISLLETNIESE